MNPNEETQILNGQQTPASQGAVPPAIPQGNTPQGTIPLSQATPPPFPNAQDDGGQATPPPPVNEPAKGSGAWKIVTIGGVSGVLIGAGAIYATTALAADGEVEEAAAADSLNTAAQASARVAEEAIVEEVEAEKEQVYHSQNGEIEIYGPNQAPQATQVDDAMSFSQAFAAARAEVGPGGTFTWHGGVYGTYYENEWRALTPKERGMYAQSVNPEHDADSTEANELADVQGNVTEEGHNDLGQLIDSIAPEDSPIHDQVQAAIENIDSIMNNNNENDLAMNDGEKAFHPRAYSVDDSMSFADAFASARAEVGAGGVFTWHGHEYNTNYASEVNAGGAAQNFTAQQSAGAQAWGVSDDMSFSQAFATARAEVGPGGTFTWHGQTYGTYYASEVDANGNPYTSSGNSYAQNSAAQPTIYAEDSAPVAWGVNDDMSFSQAFAAARAEVGPGGVFTWHGQTYGTYYANEWNNMSQGQRDLYAQSLPSGQVTTNDNLVAVNDETGQGIAAEDDGAEYLGAQEITADDGTVMTLHTVRVDGQEVAYLDADGDGSLDYAMADLNGDGTPQTGEIYDLHSGEALDLTAMNADDPTNFDDPSVADGTVDTGDYINDADVQLV